MLVPLSALILLSLALAWSIVFKAGVWPEDWAVTVLVVGIVSFAYWLVTPRPYRAPRLKPWLYLAIGFLICYLVFQLIPLPLAALDILSPARATLVRALAPVAGMSWAPLSVNPPAAVLSFFTILACIATFLLVRELAWRFSARPWVPVIPLIFLAALEAAAGLFQVFGTSSAAEASGTYTNRDHFSGFLEMIFPFAALSGLAILRRAKDRLHSAALPAIAACGAWAVSALLLLAIVYSLSRMGLLAALCALFVIAVFSLPVWRWSSLAIIAAGIVLLVIFFPPSQWIERFAAGKISADTRLAFWKDTLPLISEFRLMGCGLGGFESVFLKYQTAATNYRVEFAHNDYLQYLAELGIIGFALLASVFFGIFQKIERGIAKLGHDDRRLLVVACAGSFAAIALHSFVDFNMYIPANAMTLAWISGIGSVNGLD